MSWFPLSVSPRYCSLGTLKFQWIQEAPGAVSCIFPNVLAPWLPVRAPMLPSECVRTLSSLPVTPALASPAHTARVSCRSPHQSVGASALPVSCRHRLVRLAVYPGLLEAWLLVVVLREREKSLPLFLRVTPVLPRVWGSVLSECLAVGPFVHSVKLFFPRAGAQVPGARGLGPPERHISLHVGSRPRPPPLHTL